MIAVFPASATGERRVAGDGMKLSVNVVHQGCYVKAGDELPEDFILPEHLDRFAVYDDPPQVSQGASRLSTVEGQGVAGARGGSAKSAADDKRDARYSEGEEEFTPKWRLKRKKGNEL